jgi:hypothetical protein
MNVACNILGCSPGVSCLIVDIHSPMKMEQTQCSETSVIKHHTPGNNPKDYTQPFYCLLIIQYLNTNSKKYKKTMFLQNLSSEQIILKIYCKIVKYKFCSDTKPSSLKTKTIR